MHSLHSYNQVQRTTETQDIAEQRVHTMNTYLIYWLLYNYAQHTEEGRPTVRDVRAEAWLLYDIADICIALIPVLVILVECLCISCDTMC